MFESTGAAGRNRTGDLRITNALLYQLSYSGNEGRIIVIKAASNKLNWLAPRAGLGSERPVEEAEQA